MREIEMGFRPPPSLGRPQGIGLAAEPCGHQQIKQRHVFQIAAAILGEEVAQDRAARFRVGLKPDKARSAIRGATCDSVSRRRMVLASRS
jgi:hypothetical protein